MEKILQKFKLYFNQERKTVFLVTFITSLIVHFQLYSLMITGADNLINNVYHQADVWEVMLLRFGLYFIQMIKGNVVSPVLVTLISSALLGITVILAEETLEIKNKYFKYIIALLFAVAPNVSATLTFFYCSDAYVLGMLLATLSVYLSRKYSNKKWMILISGSLLALAISMYQTYLSVTMCLCIFTLILDAINKKPIKEIFKNLIRYLMLGIIGIALFYILSHAIVSLAGLPVASYSGGNEIGINTFLNFSKLLPEAYQSFFNYYFNDEMIPNTIWGTNIMYIIIFTLILIAMIYIVIKNKVYKNISNTIFAIIFIAISPICFGIIEIIVPDVDIHILMACSMIYIFLMFFKILELLPKTSMSRIIKGIVVVCTLAIVWIYTWQDNATYNSMKLMDDQARETVNRIVTQIEELDEYTPEMPVLFIGGLQNNRYLSRDNTDIEAKKIFDRSWGFISEGPIVWWGNLDSWKKLLYEYQGVNMNLVSEGDNQKILETEEYKSMKCYPEKDSIKVIDGTVVIKLID